MSASATSVPSHAHTNSPNACDHDRVTVGRHPANRPNNTSSGNAPIRSRTLLNAVEDTGRHPSPANRPNTLVSIIARNVAA